MPLVIHLHGAGGTARRSIRQTGWPKKADAEGFVVVLADGTRLNHRKRPQFFTNPQVWADGSGRTHAEQAGIDDVAFIDSLIGDVSSRYPIDPQRVYLSGFSNGGSLALRAAERLSDRIAGVVSVAGTYIAGEEPAPHRMIQPVSMLFMVGALDPLVPLLGGEVRLPWGAVAQQPPITESVLAWVDLIGAPHTPKRSDTDDGLRVLRYGPGRGRSEVVFYTIPGHGHVWPGGRSRLPASMVGPTTGLIDATHSAWSFFSRHRRMSVV